MSNKFKFTEPRLRNIPTPDKIICYYDEVQPGLRLLVTTTGNKSFQFQMWSKNLGKPLTKTLGKLGIISLFEARKQAATLITELNAGIDIENTKRESKRARLREPTVSDFSLVFIERHCLAKQLRTTKEIQRILDKEILPEIGKLKISDVKKADILHLLDKIQDRGKLTQCNRTHSVLNKLFNFALERDVVETSPMYSLKKRGIEVKRDRVLSNEEIKLLWESLGNSTTSMLIKFLLLTGQRTGETRFAKWSEINEGMWLIPAENTKNGTPHRVPLSSGAMDIIEHMKTISHGLYVFPGKKSGGRIQELQLDKDVPGHHLQRVIAKFEWERTTVHDLRRTMRSKLSELGVTPMVAEKILNHKIPGVLPIYDRHDYLADIQDAMQRWSDFLQKILSGKSE